MSELGTNRSGSDFAAMLFIGFAASAILDLLPKTISIAIISTTFAAFIIGGIVERLRRNRNRTTSVKLHAPNSDTRQSSN